MTPKCPVCKEYMFDLFGPHRCGRSYQVVIIGNDDPPNAPFQLREQLSVRRVFSIHGIDDAAENAVADYHARAEYADSTTVGAMSWLEWQAWDEEHADDYNALLDPALLTWYEVTLRMEPSYAVRKLGGTS